MYKETPENRTRRESMGLPWRDYGIIGSSGKATEKYKSETGIFPGHTHWNGSPQDLEIAVGTFQVRNSDPAMTLVVRYQEKEFDLRPGTLQPYQSGDFVEPSTDEIRYLLRSQKWTGADAAAIVGVDSRTIRRWTGGERGMPYAAWRLLLIEAGLIGH